MSPYREMERFEIAPKPLKIPSPERIRTSQPAKSGASVLDYLANYLIRTSVIDELSITELHHGRSTMMSLRRGDNEVRFEFYEEVLCACDSPWAFMIEKFFKLEWELLTENEKNQRKTK